MGNHMTCALDDLLLPPRAAGARRGAAGAARGTTLGISMVPAVLAGLLAVQAVLSLRLVWSNTAFLDEATYLFAGHVELGHLLHGSGVPAYPAYFSGAPVIYPPLAALANDIGGLAAARMLSLGFMLGATAILWGMTARLAGRLAAFFAAALFATLGPTQFLGAFATYDAMALFLLSAAAWCAVAAGKREDSAWLVLGGAALLVAANATKYATGLFDPVVIALAALAVAERRGVKPAIARGGYFAVAAVGMLGILLSVGGPLYLTGVLSTTLARPESDTASRIVIMLSAKWIGLVVLLAVAGAVAGAAAASRSRSGRYASRHRAPGPARRAPDQARRDRVMAVTAAVLAGAGFLVTAEQARIHTATSLSKHVDFGAWFAAAAAGYLLARLVRASRPAWAHTLAAATVAGAVVLPAGAAGRAQAAGFFHQWADATQVTRVIGALVRTHPGNYLAEDYDVPAYYLQDRVSWRQWSNTWYFVYTPPGTKRRLSGLPAWRAAIRDHAFSLVILNFGDTARVDSFITSVIRQSGDYHVIAVAKDFDSYGTGQYTVWAYQPRRTRPRRTRARRPPAAPAAAAVR